MFKQRRLTAFFLAMAMVFSMAVSVYADEQETGTIELRIGDPDPSELPESGSIPPETWQLSSTSKIYTNVSDASAYMRSCLQKRINAITINYRFSGNLNDTSLMSRTGQDIYYGAFEESKSPVQGDYLRYQTGSWNVSISGSYNGQYTDVTYAYNVYYYTNAEHESTVSSKAASVLNSLKLSGLGEYEKIKAVYDYVTGHVTYDYEHLNQKDYVLKNTAYGALVNGTAVCQGYTVLLYRLLRECGIDCRIVAGYGYNLSTGTGEPHGWNIVKLGNKYYNVDATWDASRAQSGLGYKYFLKSDDSFSRDHLRTTSIEGDQDYVVDYTSAAFYAAYPMAADDFDVKFPFTDVSKTDWYYKSVRWAYETGVTAGTTATTFEPYKTCTRAEFVTFLYKFIGKPWKASWASGCSFADVKSSDWYYKAVVWANQAGVTNGMNGKFKPNETLDRGMIISFLYNMEKYRNGTPKITLTKTKFKDVSSKNYFFKPVLWAEQYKITNGTSDSTFSPAKKCTRAEAVTFLYNINNYWN